jgi:hypothetical protein
VEPLEPVPLVSLCPYGELLPGVADELLELVLGFWPYVEDDVLDCPLVPIDEVSVDEGVLAVALPDVPLWLADPCVLTWPWLPAALWVPSTVPCVLVPVVAVFEAARVSLFDPEHAASNPAAPSAVTR